MISMQLKVSSKGKDPLQFINDIKYQFFPEVEGKIIEFSEFTVNRMREIIKANKKRPSLGSNLEDTIDYEILNSVGGVSVGIGNLTLLDSKAPYYEVLNNGGYIPYSTRNAAPLGSFYGDRPIQGGSGQNWERSGNKGFLMIPKKPIEGILYIDQAARDLKNKLEIELRDWIQIEIEKQAR